MSEIKKEQCKGETNQFFGKHHSKEIRQILSDINSQTRKINSPIKEEFIIVNLQKFCCDNNLQPDHLIGKDGSKGWKATKILN